ncbi:hypothetical protein CDD83_1162 [Cordyceps sp. RAO-2017]|nr:hypothetical protein CDD83_1162 [Cordyceps sp. RAO-2017]
MLSSSSDDAAAAGASSSPAAGASSSPPRKPLDAAGLSVDDAGTIYDRDGVPVGRMTQPEGPPPPRDSPSASGPAKAPAAAVTPSPSEVYLDVKSTHDGIQLIIKIPTVLNMPRTWST